MALPTDRERIADLEEAAWAASDKLKELIAGSRLSAYQRSFVDDALKALEVADA